jgi:cytochrome c-type biogenesis protein CcmH
MKAVQSGALALAVCFSMGATDANSRFDDLGQRLMCTCGCLQTLGKCDHFGCPSRGQEDDEIKAEIAAGKSDKEILASFVTEYGAIVLAAPTTKGFDLVAWVAPFAVFGAALLGTILLIRRWGGLGGEKAARAAATTAGSVSLDPAEQERRERIRRETGMGGDFSG